MVVGLSGIEKVIKTTNPETLKPETYMCSGYLNTGRFVGDKLVPGKLVDWYRPLSKEGQHHSQEFLYLCHKKYERPYEEILKGDKRWPT